MEPRLRASPEQFASLVNFMESNGDIARLQQGLQGRLKADRLWQELTNLLNSISGGVTRSMGKWKKVWADWKTKTKKKCLMMHREARRTGGGPSSRQSLTGMEKRVVAILGLSAVVGQRGNKERGFQIGSIQSLRGQSAHNEINLNIPTTGNSLEERALCVLTNPHSPVEVSQNFSPTSLPALMQMGMPSMGVHPSSIAPTSSAPATSPPVSRQQRLRRLRAPTSFERAMRVFVTVERRRLQLEENRERNLHQREMERLKIETKMIEIKEKKIKVQEQHNELFQRITDNLERLTGAVLHLTQSE